MRPGRIIVILIVGAAIVLGWRLVRPPAQPEEESVTTEVAVRAGMLKRLTLHRFVSAFGVVEARPAGSDEPGGGVQLSAPVPGLVAEVLCNEGQRVARGDVLVRLDTRPVDVQIQRAREQAAFAEQQYTRQEQLLAVSGTSQRAIQEAREALNIARDALAAAEAQRALLQIAAPFSGVVARVRARPGQSVDLSSVLIELIDPDNLIITAGIPTAQLGGLRAGQAVQITVADDQQVLHGTLNFLSPQVDPQTGTALARVSIPADAGLYSGQYVEIDIEIETRSDRLAAPAESVVRNEDGETVIAVIEGNRAVQVPVQTGLQDGAWIEIEEDGLSAGDLVVTVGAFGLPEETAVRVLAD